MMNPRTTPALLLACLAALLAMPLAARADSIRCDGGIVAVGDSKLDLLGKCGHPTLREEVPAAVGVYGATGTARPLVVQERWTYNFGPRAFVQVVTLEVGVVKAIHRGGYGYDLGGSAATPARLPRATCSHSGSFSVGDSTFEVLARCGEPALREETLAQVAVETPGARGTSAFIGTTTVRVELWTYDFGPQVNVRRLEFEAGRLARVVSSGYGYSR
jgi:hypothetical protein